MEEIIKKVDNLCGVKITIIANEMGLSKTSGFKTLYDDLGLRKVSAPWISKLPTPLDEKFARII